MTVEVKNRISEVNISTGLSRGDLNNLSGELTPLGELGEQLSEIVWTLAGAVSNIDNAVGILNLAATIRQDGSFRVSLSLAAESERCFLSGGADVPIAELGLGKRAQNTLATLKVTTTAQLTQLTADDLRSVPGCGATTLNEIIAALEKIQSKLKDD